VVWIKVSQPYVLANIDKNIGTEPQKPHMFCVKFGKWSESSVQLII